jgi:hypothetical protein
MRQYLSILTLVFTVLVGCKKENTKGADCFEINPVSTGNPEDFKIINPIKYSIEFPTSFMGGLQRGFEGNLFHKYHLADSIDIRYNNCSGLYCYDFGSVLSDINQLSIQANMVYGQPPILLDNRIEFRKNNVLIGIFYHSNGATSWGKLFWKDSGEFKDALNAKFKRADLMRIVDIIRTIREM